MPLTKLEVVSSSTASQFFTSSQVPGDVGAADNGLHDGPWHVSRHNQVGEQLERTEPAGLAGQTEAPLSVFTGATVPKLLSILVTKERTEFYEEPTPISLIVCDPS